MLEGVEHRSPTVFLIVAIGTIRERGLPDRGHKDVPDQFLASLELYDLPFGLMSFLSSRSWVRYVPFCPRRDRKTDGRTEVNNEVLRQGRKFCLMGKVTVEKLFEKMINT